MDDNYVEKRDFLFEAGPATVTVAVYRDFFTGDEVTADVLISDGSNIVFLNGEAVDKIATLVAQAQREFAENDDGSTENDS